MGKNGKNRDFDAAAATWDEDPKRVALGMNIVAAIKTEVPISNDWELLDFGCGSGLVTLELAPLVKSVHAVDTSSGMLDVLKGKLARQNIANVYPQFLELEELKKTNRQWDMIVTSMVMHHVQDVERAISVFFERLRPNGTLCIADLDLDQGRFHDDNTGVFHPGFDRTILAKSLVQAGFRRSRFVTAHTVEKPAGKFSVFLGVATK